MDPAELMADVRTLFRTCRRLEEATGLPFGPDGYTLGSAGEVVAAWVYGLQLVDGAANAGFGAVVDDDQQRTVQIESTTKGLGEGVGWRDLTPRPDVLLVIRLDPAEGTVSELFNGPYEPLWDEYLQHRKLRSASNTRSVRINALLEHAALVPASDRLPQLHDFPTF